MCFLNLNTDQQKKSFHISMNRPKCCLWRLETKSKGCFSRTADVNRILDPALDLAESASTVVSGVISRNAALCAPKSNLKDADDLYRKND